MDVALEHLERQNHPPLAASEERLINGEFDSVGGFVDVRFAEEHRVGALQVIEELGEGHAARAISGPDGERRVEGGRTPGRVLEGRRGGSLADRGGDARGQAKRQKRRPSRKMHGSRTWKAGIRGGAGS